jgi:iron complex outermembrane receptor protein
MIPEGPGTSMDATHNFGGLMRVLSGQFRLSPIAALIGGLFAASSAHAADDAAPVPGTAASAPAASTPPANTKLDSVVVTARRRLETLFDVPAAVTAISGDSLRAKGITNVQDIVALVPNAVIPDDPQNFNTYINIRGIRQADPQAEPNFGLYRNGIYDGGHRTNLGAMVDIDRVELLRGPQGGLYGRNAVGGALDIIYKMPRPGETTNGYATLSVENDERNRFEGAVSLPSNENVSTRVTGWFIDQRKGEYYNETLNEQIDKSRDEGLRVSTAVNFSSAWSGLWTLEYQKTDGPSQRAYAPDGIQNGSVKSPAETPGTIQRDTPSRNDTTQYYATQKLTYAADAGTLTMLAAFRDYSLDGIEDADFTALPVSAGPVVLKQAATRAE